VIGSYYDPTAGQLITVDPLVDKTGQPYAHVGGNPVKNADLTGDLGGGNVLCDGLPVVAAAARPHGVRNKSGA
jgi:hypothetical protein